MLVHFTQFSQLINIPRIPAILCHQKPGMVIKKRPSQVLVEFQQPNKSDLWGQKARHRLLFHSYSFDVISETKLFRTFLFRICCLHPNILVVVLPGTVYIWIFGRKYFYYDIIIVSEIFLRLCCLYLRGSIIQTVSKLSKPSTPSWNLL